MYTGIIAIFARGSCVPIRIERLFPHHWRPLVMWQSTECKFKFDKVKNSQDMTGITCQLRMAWENTLTNGQINNYGLQSSLYLVQEFYSFVSDAILVMGEVSD